MPGQGEPGLVFALALGVGVLSQLVARHLRIPSIVVLLAAGVALGPDGLGWIIPATLGDGLLALVGIAVAVILFEGGLNLEIRRLRREQSAIRTLVTTGAFITAFGGTLAARLVMDWPWAVAAVFGTLVIVTGPTVIRPLLRNVPLRPRLATVLESEGVLIDPVGAVMAAVTLEVVLATLEAGSAMLELGLRLGFGAAAGLLAGALLAWLLRMPRVVPEGLENLVTLGGVLVLFEGCDVVMSESGILAVTVAGVVLGNLKTRVGRELREFQDLLTMGLIGVLFVLLAADVRLDDLSQLGWQGVGTVAVLVFLVRPLNVFASTSGSELHLREKLFLSWTAPRGIVAAAIASLAAVLMERAGMWGGPELRALVFLTIAITVLLQGGTAPLVARALKVRAPGREAVVILGAEELGFALGEVLREGGVQVGFVDANPVHCRHAQERGFPVVFGNALEERVLARARLEQARSVVGATANAEVNSLFAREARDDFGVRDTYVAIDQPEAGVTKRLLEKQESRVLFDGPKDVERWSVRLRHGATRLRYFRRRERKEGEGEEPEAAGARFGAGVEPYLVLAYRRGEQWAPAYASLEAKADDVVAVAIHLPEEEAALEALERFGWEPAPEEEPSAEAGDPGSGITGA